MNDLDFLPLEYRQRHDRRRRQKWRNIAIGLVGLLAAATACHQQLARRQLLERLAEVTPQYERVIEQTQQLGRLQSELAAARVDAELFTYLRHPWPRTQILAALLTELPEEIGFTKLDIRRQAQPVRPGGEHDPLSALSPQAGSPAVERPAAIDQTRLRQQYDRARTVVAIEGLASDSSALHQYLSRMNRSEFCPQAELESLEADRLGEEPMLRFQATLVVCPGYGMPHGPAPALREPVAALGQ